MQIQIINGPNLNLLGVREPGIYGQQTFESYFQELQQRFVSLTLGSFQSNVEGELIDCIQRHGLQGDKLVINPGGYSHTSVAIRDAIAAVGGQAIEVHLSNLHAREAFRHQSITAGACIGVISGFGLAGYEMAIQRFLAS
ncbi:MAG: type II 3-dehydroquinate dehydratase [Flavobacteriales bacterium]